jgi:lipopolysaccharide/colanic/teichoic acid biosynthesis glycosyltransferase
MIKHAFDIVVAAFGLMLCAPLFLLVAALIKLDSKGTVFFHQERVGKHFRPFHIYKFRSMILDAPRQGALISVAGDPRVTRIGRLLRKTKIDELPQLINILKGEMSFVGPRPEVPKYVQLFRKDYEEILQVNPGITDLASLKYRDEAGVLGQSANPEQEYIARVLPDKIQLAKDYLRRSSFFFDLTLILRTSFRLFS